MVLPKEDETHINGDEGEEEEEEEKEEEEHDEEGEEANQYHSEEIYPIMTLAQLLILRQKFTFSPVGDDFRTKL